MKKTVYLYSGEGTHGSEPRLRLLRQSSLWKQIEAILDAQLNLKLEQFWNNEIQHHSCPHSPLITVIGQICLADLWSQWGYRPDVVLGHSTGELAAAYQAGFYSLDEVLLLADSVGRAAAPLKGEMRHGWVSEEEIVKIQANVSALNFKEKDRRHVTVSGRSVELAEFFQKHPDFIKMKPPHPWHHPDYHQLAGQIKLMPSKEAMAAAFVSGVTAKFENRLPDDYWRKWLTSPVDFIQAIQAIRERYTGIRVDIVEIGFHPVLSKSCEVFREYVYASSMFRGEDEIGWILFQRRKLDQSVFRKEIEPIISAFRPGLDYDAPLAYQDFTSMDFVQLTALLRPYFPTLAPQDFYRHKSINRLIEGFGQEKTLEPSSSGKFQRNAVVISAMSCRFPSSVETLPQFWEMLQSKTDQVGPSVGRGVFEAGFLDEAVTRFDHHFFNISQAEARTMDPQQILALELTEMLWRDAGIDPERLDRKRVGVYIGAWNQEFQGDRTSVYYPTGVNPSIIAARISYHYDLRGPSWISNTACSSSLLAVHYAAKDIEAGRIDYAIAGGVNMLLDEEFTVNMKNSGFLSKDNRCKTFDNSADGYVRAEGGGLVLLVNKTLAAEYYAELTGSAVNQNGGRAQVITAPHPEAQEELMTAACRDAGILPQEIAYIECHGTGTKIGDPIEIAAIQNTIGKDRINTLYIGSVKSNLGHLESAAGIAGLIKCVAALNHGVIPPNLHFSNPNQFIDFKSHPIEVVSKATPIDPLSYMGISSFGFGGSNAHIIVKGADPAIRKKITSVEVPFDRKRGAALNDYVHLNGRKILSDTSNLSESLTAGDQIVDDEKEIEHSKKVERAEIDRLIKKLFFQLTGIEEIDPDIELTEQGLDSMSAAELVAQLENGLTIEIDPEILFEYPLLEQFTDEIYILTAKKNGK